MIRGLFLEIPIGYRIYKIFGINKHKELKSCVYRILHISSYYLGNIRERIDSKLSIGKLSVNIQQQNFLWMKFYVEKWIFSMQCIFF